MAYVVIVQTVYLWVGMQEHSPSTDDNDSDSSLRKSKPSVSPVNTSKESHKTPLSARATDSARVMKFKKELSVPTVTLGTTTIFWG